MVARSVISWKAKLQGTMALSTTEVEYMAVVETSKEIIWLKGLVEIIGIIQDLVQVHCNSQSAIILAKKHMYHK